MRIAVIGTGYVGLVAGTCFAESGNSVTCVDIDARKIRRLEAGEIPLYEPGLEELLRRNVHDGRLRFTTRYEDAIPRAQVAFIAVGTPQDEDGSADLRYVLAAAREIARTMTGYLVVVDKSTVPVGTARKVHEALKANTSQPFDVEADVPIRSVNFIIDGVVRKTLSPNTASLKLTQAVEMDGAHYVYVHLLLADGNHAWSSPIWVQPQAAK
jgi:nucleotide sugar dehydrogenase